MCEEISWKEYRSLRLSDLKKTKYRHLWLLLYWPVEIALFFFLEHLPLERHVMHCALDDLIPFCEIWILPYVLWFACVVFITLFTLFRDVGVFRRYMDYMILTVLVAFAVFLLYPSVFVQPDLPSRRSVLLWIVGVVYGADEPTNVFPSEHVVVALGMVFAVLQSPKLRRPAFAVPFLTLQLLICLSVVFVKQHSALDILGALPLVLLGYLSAASAPGPASAAGKRAPARKPEPFSYNLNSSRRRGSSPPGLLL